MLVYTTPDARGHFLDPISPPAWHSDHLREQWSAHRGEELPVGAGHGLPAPRPMTHRNTALAKRNRS